MTSTPACESYLLLAIFRRFLLDLRHRYRHQTNILLLTSFFHCDAYSILRISASLSDHIYITALTSIITILTFFFPYPRLPPLSLFLALSQVSVVLPELLFPVVS